MNCQVFHFPLLGPITLVTQSFCDWLVQFSSSLPLSLLIRESQFIGGILVIDLEYNLPLCIITCHPIFGNLALKFIQSPTSLHTFLLRNHAKKSLAIFTGTI